METGTCNLYDIFACPLSHSHITLIPRNLTDAKWDALPLPLQPSEIFL